MAKYKVGDKLILAENYMDGRFKKNPTPKKVVIVDEGKKRYLLLSPNDSPNWPTTGDGNGYIPRYWFTFQYVDNSFRLATPNEASTLFNK